MPRISKKIQSYCVEDFALLPVVLGIGLLGLSLLPLSAGAAGRLFSDLPSLRLKNVVTPLLGREEGGGGAAQHELGKLELNDIFLMARSGHPVIASRKADIEAADAVKLGAQLRFLPAPSLDSTSRDGKSATITRLEQPLWTGGKLSANLDSADTRLRSSTVALSEAEVTLFLHATSLYQNYLALESRIAILDKGIEQMLGLVEMIIRRAQAGTSASADVDLAHSRVGQLRTERISALNSLNSVLAQLSQVTGQTITRGMLSTRMRKPASVDAVDLEQRALDSYPTLQRAQLDIDLATAEKALAKSVLWPTVSLRAEHQEGQYIGSLQPGNRVYLALSYTPGAGLASLADVNAASARIRSAESELQTKRRDLLVKLRSEFTDYESARQRQPELTRNSALTADIFESSTRLFVLGRRSWLDLLNAVKEMVAAQQQDADNQAQAYGTYRRLRLLGGDAVLPQE